MIWTVFPKDENILPHDCETYQEAKEWAKELDCEYEIESTKGECV